MSEKHRPSSHEALPHNNHKQIENRPQLHEKELTKAEKEHGQEHHVERLVAQAEKHAIPIERHTTAAHEQAKHHPVLVNKELKNIAFNRAMTRARKRLSAPARVFSKLTHSPVIDKPSEVIGTYVARPSAMLGGAFIAFIGTSLLLWATRHYGYEYNYLAVLLLFAIGILAGLTFEGLFKYVRKSR